MDRWQPALRITTSSPAEILAILREVDYTNRTSTLAIFFERHDYVLPEPIMIGRKVNTIFYLQFYPPSLPKAPTNNHHQVPHVTKIIFTGESPLRSYLIMSLNLDILFERPPRKTSTS